MKSYTLQPRQIQLNDEYEVIVAGGGPAGCAAAIASARRGAKTLLIEATGCLGGMGTMGLVPAWCPFSDKEKIIYKGIAEEIFKASNAGLDHVKPTDMDWVPIDPEHLKQVYDEKVTGSGAHVLFNKPVAISGISPAMTGASHAQDELLVVLGFIGARTMTMPRLVVGNALTQMDGNTLRLESSLPYLERQAQAFVDFIGGTSNG